MSNKKYFHSGFIALISVIVISAVLLAVASSLSLRGIFTQSNVVDSENKKVSHALAQICLDTAVLKLQQDENYSGGEVLSQELGFCSVCPISKVAGVYTIDTRSIIQNAFTNLEMKINSSDYSIQSVQELPTYPRFDCSF